MKFTELFKLAALLFVVITASGCMKCYECQILDKDGEVYANMLEVCVSKKDYKLYQKQCAESLEDGQTCNCYTIR